MRLQYAQIHKEARRFREYFCCSELFETLRKGQNLPPARELRRYIYRSGADYEGEWRGGFRDGHGKMTYRDGSVYEGEWSYGYPAGQGQFRHYDGEVFSGKWLSPYPVVHVSIKIVGKETVAKWKAGLSNGYGKVYIEWLSYKTSIEFRAKTCTEIPLGRLDSIEAKLAKMKEMLAETKMAALTRSLPANSPCALAYKDGGSYKGSAVSGKREGYGEMTWANGDTYKGEWRENEQTGWGISRWTNGSSYIGTYANSQKEGVGEYVWGDGKRYMGEWKGNLMQGVGEHTWGDGRCYRGEWKAGVIHGYGKLEGGKDSFQGFWKQGKPRKAV